MRSGRSNRRGREVAAIGVLVLSICGHALAHNDHMLVGRSAAGQLTWQPVAGVEDNHMAVLEFIPPGGPIEGYSAAVPGFSMILQSAPADDVYVCEAGSEIWIEVLQIDRPMLLIDTPSYEIVNYRTPMELRVGAGSQTHVHPLWLLDTSDPAYDGSRCIWEVTFVLKDKGATHYQTSAPITFRFVAGAAPCPADFDCDDDVDGEDLQILQACATRASVAYDAQALPGTCPSLPDHHGLIRPDIDRDGDVDLEDFGRFQRCFRGAGIPADPACAD
jgi:hypothetical protein